MNLVLVDVQADALADAEAAFQGHPVLARQLDRQRCADGSPGCRGGAAFWRPALRLQQRRRGLWRPGLENPLADWRWVLDVNLMGVVHGVRLFTPMMLAAAAADPTYQGHIVNTASMAGLVNSPNMGVYNVSKAAVVS